MLSFPEQCVMVLCGLLIYRHHTPHQNALGMNIAADAVSVALLWDRRQCCWASWCMCLRGTVA